MFCAKVYTSSSTIHHKVSNYQIISVTFFHYTRYIDEREDTLNILSFSSSNSSFIECVRNHNPFYFSNEEIIECTTDAKTPCDTTTRNSLLLGTAHTIDSCEFNSITSQLQRGGVIYIHSDGYSDDTSLTVTNSVFKMCSVASTYIDRDGGGAIYMDTGSFLSVTSTEFNSCSSKSHAGGVYAQYHIKSCIVSLCTFIYCRGNHGGGLLTLYGPTSSVFSSRFISCKADNFGGGLYHDSNSTYSDLILTNSLFADNNAMCSSGTNRGGGAFEDYRWFRYVSTYSFSFFTGNIAFRGKGDDISIMSNPLSQSSIIQSFTAATSGESFYNAGSAAHNWLPLCNIYEDLDESEASNKLICTHNRADTDKYRY